MPGSKDILLYDRYKEFADKLIAEADVICCLDFNALKRIDDMADAIAASPARKIMIDHHLYPEEFCKITMSYPKISSTSELIYRLICRMGYFSDISKEGAECIYTGMMTDTGGFTYSLPYRQQTITGSAKQIFRRTSYGIRPGYPCHTGTGDKRYCPLRVRTNLPQPGFVDTGQLL